MGSSPSPSVSLFWEDEPMIKQKTRFGFLKIFILAVLIISFIVSAQNTELTDIKRIIPDIVLDIRYATSDNFTGKVLYSSDDCFIAKEVALALKKVQDDLKKQGYRLKIFDGYRPLSVQKKMWEVCPDANFVANPKKGSVHNKGYAVDLTIIALDGSPVKMPTDFDEFTIKAGSGYKDLQPDVIKNREILQQAMIKHGFLPIKTEWWHFNYSAHRDKPVLDIPFDTLKSEK